jgi:hypothetical protein
VHLGPAEVGAAVMPCYALLQCSCVCCFCSYSKTSFYRHLRYRQSHDTDTWGCHEPSAGAKQPQDTDRLFR